ncbi:unnamed protein product, partial [Prorocentrum cordatum]
MNEPGAPASRRSVAPGAGGAMVHALREWVEQELASVGERLAKHEARLGEVAALAQGGQAPVGQASGNVANTELLHMLDDRVRLISSLEERVKAMEGQFKEVDAQHDQFYNDQIALQERLDTLEQGAESLAAQSQELERRLAAMRPGGQEGRSSSPEARTTKTNSSPTKDLANTELLHMLDDRVRLISSLEERAKEAKQRLDDNDARHDQAYDDRLAIQERAEALEGETAALAARSEQAERRLAALEAKVAAARPGSPGGGRMVKFASQDECVAPGEQSSPTSEPSLAARLRAKEGAAMESLEQRVEALEKQ